MVPQMRSDPMMVCEQFGSALRNAHATAGGPPGAGRPDRDPPSLRLAWLGVGLLLLAAGEARAQATNRFEADIQAFELADRRTPPPTNAVLFVGSSSLRLWSDLTAAFPGSTVLKRGFGGSHASDVLYFFDRVVKPYRPRLIVYYEGDNDLVAGKPVSQVFGDWTNFVARVEQELPGTGIAFIAVKPSPSRIQFLEQQRALNALVRGHCERRPWLRFVDVFTPMLSATGHARSDLFMPDRLHLNAAGYALWQSLLWPVVGEDAYFPPPESQGGWRKLDKPDDVRARAGMDPEKLAGLRGWLLQSDDRNFAAVVIRRGWIVLQVGRGNSAVNDTRRVASVSKAICATVLSIASEQSQQGLTPRRMKFEDPAFAFIPWAHPLSDPRKAAITVRQLFNHTSGLCPEATGAGNDGSWEYILGHTGDAHTAQLAFDPGTACGYSTHALSHAALVCETVTGKPYDQFAIDALFKPIGIERWWFQYYDGGPSIGRHPSHGLGLSARDLARIAYCLLQGGRWEQKQVIPRWFVDQTAAPTHNVLTPEMRWQLNPRIFSHGWELPASLTGEDGRRGDGIPCDARSKPGSGGQLIAFVPSLDLVITRQTGVTGPWAFEEYLRRACAAVLPSRCP